MNDSPDIRPMPSRPKDGEEINFVEDTEGNLRNTGINQPSCIHMYLSAAQTTSEKPERLGMPKLYAATRYLTYL